MNNEERQIILNNLENKEITIANTIVNLAFQGYSVNQNKNIKLSLAVILTHLFTNIDLFTEEQKNNIELLYNKFLTL